MFCLKAAKLMQLKQKWADHRELEAEIEDMVAQLAQTASPEIAMQVEQLMLKTPRATRLITGEDGEDFQARVAKRRSTVHHLTDSAATERLVSISPGVSGLSSGLSESVPEVFIGPGHAAAAGQKPAFSKWSDQ